MPPRSKYKSKPKKLSKPVAKQVNQISKSQVNRSLDTHYNDEYQNPVDINTTATITKLSTISVGDGVYDSRQGNTIKPIDFTMRYWIYPPATCDTYGAARIILFQWKADDGAAAPTENDLLDEYTQTKILSRTAKEEGKIKVLYDQTHLFGAVATNAMAQVPMHFRVIKIKGKNMLTIRYDEALNTGLNQLYIYSTSTLNDALDNPHFTYHSLLRWKE